MRSALVCTFLLLSAFPQALSTTENVQARGSTDFVVHINVNLVQIDAVVTDSKGKPVSGLRQEDFEVLQDGKPQKITNLNYIEPDSRPASPAVIDRREKDAVAPPPVALKPEQVRRVIALVVDDLGTSFAGMAQVRAALKKFVDHEIRPGDLVAIIRTGGGIGALQQFTTDKRLLYSSIDRLKYNLSGRIGSFEVVPPPPLAGSPALNPTTPTVSMQSRSSVPRMMSQADDSCVGVGSTAASLNAVRYIIQGLRDLPGRKALVLFSESMQISDRPINASPAARDVPESGGSRAWFSMCDYSTVRESLRRLTDAAERATVVIYTVDPRGVDPLIIDASEDPLRHVDSMAAQPWNVLSGAAYDRRAAYWSQAGMLYLADETGGTFATHNDIAGAVREVVNDSGSYYLIGYHPPASTFEGKDSATKFHTVEVVVKRGGLRVRSRTGFYGFPGRIPDPPALSPDQQLAHALASPFAVNDLPLRITSQFFHLDSSFITTLLYIDGGNLSFNSESNGTHRVAIEVLAAAFNVGGLARGSIHRNYVLLVDDKDYARAVNNGVTLMLQYATPEPGPYQMRIAVRDLVSQKIGSATQFVDVPNLKRRRLALSGIMLQDPGAAANGGASESGTHLAIARNPNGNEAVRAFQPGETVKWGLQILNARAGPRQKPAVLVQMRIFRDGREIYGGDNQPVRWPDTVDADHLAASGQFEIGPKLGPGDYALQVMVTDSMAKKKYATASQMDRL